MQIPEKYRKKLKTPIGKIWREHIHNRDLCKAIVAFQPDLIHANDLDALIPAMQAAKKLKCRVVYDSHELCAENNYVVRNKARHWYYSVMEKKLVGKCDQMVCVSHAAASYFAEKYGIPKPMVVTNCMLQEYIPAETVPKNPGFEILNHGTFSAGRGYDTVAKACPLLKNYPEIRLAIRGLGSMEQELRQIVSQQENKACFSFYPPVTAQELTAMAARSHVGVAITEPICLNFKLSVSNKLFEYAAAGLPVIMSDIPEHRYLNDRYAFGLILPENTPEALAAAAIQLYEDQALYQRLSDNAKKMTREINWENEFKKLIERERELVG